MDLQTIFYHARIVHLRNVLTALGPVRVAKGMTAFDDGESNWSNCFFARAFKGELNLNHNAEHRIQNALHLPTRVSIRFTWRAFDSAKDTGMTREALKDMIEKITAKTNDEAVDKFLASIEFNESEPVELVCD